MEWILENYRLVAWVISGVFAAGGAWAVLYLKERQLGKELTKLEIDSAANDAATEERLDRLAQEFNSHKHETTDRLARIETKIDILVSQIAKGV